VLQSAAATVSDQRGAGIGADDTGEIGREGGQFARGDADGEIRPDPVGGRGVDRREPGIDGPVGRRRRARGSRVVGADRLHAKIGDGRRRRVDQGRLAHVRPLDRRIRRALVVPLEPGDDAIAARLEDASKPKDGPGNAERG